MTDIEFTCEHCEQSLEAPEDMAGEEIECPNCGATITIPGEEVAAEHSAEPVTACPSCSSPLTEGVVLCVHCGYHMKLGKRIQTDLR